MTSRIGDLELDCIVRIVPNHRNEATMHPVETGANITDHVIERPLTVEVVSIVSDTPIGLVADARSDNSIPSDIAYTYLTRLMADKELVSIESGVYPVFKDMLLLSLTPPKDATTGASFRFTASFQQTVFSTVNVDDIETLVALPLVKKKKQAGNVDTSADGPSAADSQPKKAVPDSHLFNAFEAVFD